MFVSLRMVTLPAECTKRSEGFAAQLRERAAALPGITNSVVEPGVPGLAFNAGDVVWRASFADEGTALAAAHSGEWQRNIAPLLAGTIVSGVGYQSTQKQIRPDGGGIWRALIFGLFPNTPAAQILNLERALLAMPREIRKIRAWGLSTISTTEGPNRFTHVWEQEFDSPADFIGEYMNHPIHWGMVDSWFDAECPQYIVDPALAQPVIGICNPVIT